MCDCSSRNQRREFKCAHGVYQDQPCGQCMADAQGPSETPSVTAESLSARAGKLEAWWLAMATEEIERTVPKAIEYGSTDLAEIGRELVEAGVHDATHATSTEELGCYFYMVGKMARWRDAIRTGRRVSDDTLFDIGVYIRMVQRIRVAGAWPGIEE